MPWDIDTYVGLEIYKPDDGARYGMHQLMIAINEREAAIGEPKTEWMLPDGTEKDEPFDVELIGADVRVGSTIKTNCDRIRTAILNLIGGVPGSAAPSIDSRVFVRGGESDVPWTLAALQIDIGHVYIASRSPQDALFLQNSKDILDRLIYVRIGLRERNRSVTRYYNTSPTTITDWNTAWSSMTSEVVVLPDHFSSRVNFRYASPAIGPSGSTMIGAAGGIATFSGDEISTCRIDDGVMELDLSPYGGIITSIRGTYGCAAAINFDDTITIDFGGISVPEGSGTLDLTSIITMGILNTINYSWDSPPATISPLGEFLAGFAIADIVAYIDLSSILLDQ